MMSPRKPEVSDVFFFQTLFQLTVGEHKETLMPSSLTTQNGV